MKKLIQYLLTLLFVATVGCSSELDYMANDLDSEIYGIWTDSIATHPKGVRVEKLTFLSNSSFIYSIEGFGIYENQNLDESSYWQKDFGNFVLSTRNIYFVSNKYRIWDFVSQETDESKIEDKVLFESCTYRIDDNKLTLKYKTTRLNSKKDTTLVLFRI